MKLGNIANELQKIDNFFVLAAQFILEDKDWKNYKTSKISFSK